MTLSWGEVALMASALPLSVVVVQAGSVAYRRLHRYAVALCVAKISAMVVAAEEPSSGAMRSLRSRFSVGVVLDAVLFVAEKIYGDSLNRIVLIVEVCELDYHLLDSIRGSRGERRVRSLSKMALLRCAAVVVESAEESLGECAESRFYTMAARISARPERAIYYLSNFDSLLTLHEVALVTQLMRRRGEAIAYTPLLTSQNRNLQLVGIYLCHHFALSDAEPHLQRLLWSEEVEVAALSLQALCAIRGDISTPQVGQALQRLSSHQRRAFILRAVHNCYSLSSCARHLSDAERATFSHRVDSYKCRIVCN